MDERWKSTEEFQKSLTIDGGEVHADDFPLGADVHGWKVVEAFDNGKYFYWAGPNVIEPADT